MRHDRVTLITAFLACSPVAALLAYVPAAVAESTLPTSSTAIGRSTSTDSQGRLEQIVELVEASNAPNLVGSDRWSGLLALHYHDIEQALSHGQFAEAVNALLGACGVSHFSYFTRSDWFYWYLLSTFEADGPDTQIAHIGLFPQRIGTSWFVRGILEGSAADTANIRVGDELLSVDGRSFSPISSFEGKEGKHVRLRLRRKPGLVYNIMVTPVKESLHEAVQRAMMLSVQTVQHEDYRYAYLHGWTLLGDADEYWKLLDMQSEVDGLLLDYRDGVGGHVGRGRGFLFGPLGEYRHWEKPTVILIADGTRSSKELLVHEVQQRGRAPLVGTPTPGQVTEVAGIHRIGKDGLLMLPGQSTALEGRPTSPDYLVKRDIRYCAGADPQLERAKEILAERIRASREARSLARTSESR
ncbi:MAG: S41 family peptidase [Planctomycetota bacterium]|jgi:carboxyl-terminal processing protease